MTKQIIALVIFLLSVGSIQAAPITYFAGESAVYNFDLTGAVPSPPFLSEVGVATGLDDWAPEDRSRWTFYDGLNATGSVIFLADFNLTSTGGTAGRHPGFLDGIFSMKLTVTDGALRGIEPFANGDGNFAQSVFGQIVDQDLTAGLPATIDFDDDVPGLPPSTGGLNQPTSLSVPSGTRITVKSAANSITTQPVVLTSSGDYVTVNYSFPEVKILRVEATVSFNRFFDGYFLQTSRSVGSAVVTRLLAFSTGEIKAETSSNSGRVTVGRYAPNKPFKVRLDIDLENGRWSSLLDDRRTTDLPFVNDLSRIPGVGTVLASLRVFPTESVGPTIVAYDDISITEIPALTRQYTDVASVPDLNGDGSPDTAGLTDRRVTILDSVTGKWLSHLSFFWRAWTVKAIETIDSNFDGMPEFAALGQNKENGRIAVQLKDIKSGEQSGWIRFFAHQPVTPIDLTVADVNFDGVPDIGVMAVRDDGRVAVEYRDAATGQQLPDWVRDRIWFPPY